MELIHNTFDAGELSPKMDGRSDLARYYRGCRTLQGFVVKPTGGALRRPGLRVVNFDVDPLDAEVTTATRLVGFVNKTDRYILAFGNYTMRVFKEAAAIMAGDLLYSITTPWSADEVFDLVFAPRGQAIFHPDHDIYELVCNGDDDWTLTAFASIYGPFLDENEDTTLTIAPNNVGGIVTLTASEDLFDADHVGALFELTHEVDEISLVSRFENSSSPPFTQNETGEAVTVKGPYEIHIEWHGWGQVQLQRSQDGSVWKTVKTWDKGVQTGVQTIEDGGEELEDNVQYRFYINWASVADPDSTFDLAIIWWLNFGIDPPYCECSIKAKNVWVSGIARITAYTSATQVTALVLVKFGGTGATYRWREGAWSAYRGYPACGTMHESRIYAARTDYQPTTLWAGRPFLRREDVRLFYAGTDVTDDDAFARTLDVKDTNVIEWLASLWVLLLGSDGNVVKGIGAGEYSPITPKDANFMAQAGMGAATLEPVMISGHIVYAGRGAQRVYEMTYSDDARIYEPEDLTRFADHITARGIDGWAFQQQPYPILWCYFDDGTFGSLTRKKGTNADEDLLAWCPQNTDGNVESIAVIPGTTEDEVWFVVARDVNGTTRRYVERMESFSHWTVQRDCFYVDNGYKWDGGAAVTITGIAVDGGTGKVTVTAASHGFTDGWTVKIASVAGMTDVNGKVYTVADGDTNTFVLKTRDGSAYIDGSAFSTYTSGGSVERVTNQITGLAWLAAESVSVLLDGQPATDSVTAAGVLTIGLHDHDFYNTIIVGRPYTSSLSPMRPELRTMTGSFKARLKKLTYEGIRVYQSAGGQMGTCAADLQAIDYKHPGDLANADKAIVSDTVSQDAPGGWTEEADILIRTSDPLPMTITEILFGVE